MESEFMKRIKMGTLFNNLKTWSGTEKHRIKTTPKQFTLRTCLRKIFQMFGENYKLISYIDKIITWEHNQLKTGWWLVSWPRELTTKTVNQDFKKLFLILMKL